MIGETNRTQLDIGDKVKILTLVGLFRDNEGEGQEVWKEQSKGRSSGRRRRRVRSRIRGSRTVGGE